MGRINTLLVLLFVFLGVTLTACEQEELNYEAEIEWIVFQERVDMETFRRFGDTVFPTNTKPEVMDFPYGTNLRKVIPVFRLSHGARTDVRSGKVMDMSEGLVLNVTSENGKYHRTYIFDLRVSSQKPITIPDPSGEPGIPKSTATLLSDFRLNGVEEAKVEARGLRISVEVPGEVGLTNLVPEWSLSEGAFSEPKSGEAFDFSQEPLFVFVTAEDSTTTQRYRIDVHHPEPVLSSSAQILSFRFGECSKTPGIIEGSRIYVLLPRGVDNHSLTPIFSLTPGATCSVPMDGTPLDFSKPTQLLVTSEDGNSTSKYTVITSGGLSSEAKLEGIAIYGAVGKGEPWKQAGNAYTFLFPPESVELDDMAVSLQISPGAKAVWSAGSATDWSACETEVGSREYVQTLTVQSEDGQHEAEYLITLQMAEKVKSEWLNSFSFGNVVSDCRIVGGDIYCSLPEGTDLTTLQPVFSMAAAVGLIKAKLWVEIDGKDLEILADGTTVVDFSKTQEISVYKGAIVKATYHIHFTFTPDPSASSVEEPKIKGNKLRFKGLSVEPVVLGNRFLFTVGTDVNLRSLTPVFNISDGATAQGLVSGQPADFASPQTLTLVSADGSKRSTYTIEVEQRKSDLANIESLKLRELDQIPSQKGSSFTIFAGSGVNVKALTVDYTLSPGASCDVASGTTLDFSSPQRLTVKSEDGNISRVYTVIVDQRLNFEADLLTFSFQGVDENCSIDGTRVTFPESVKGVASLVPLFTVSPGATTDWASGTARDFSKPVQLKVTSEDKSQTKTYTISQKVNAQAQGHGIFFDFESWEKVKGKKMPYYKPSSGGWASANNGAMVSIDMGLGPDKFPVYPSIDAHSGSKCAAIETIEFGKMGVPIVAGAMYIGTFDGSVVQSAPLTAPHFGMPWPAGKLRPDRFKGWYKYKSGESMVGGAGPDDFAIYAILYYGKQINATEAPTCTRIIAKAELTDRVASGEWVEFDIPFKEILSQGDVPEDATLRYSIVLTSSRNGNTYTGAPGSLLLVDDLEISLK